MKKTIKRKDCEYAKGETEMTSLKQIIHKKLGKLYSWDESENLEKLMIEANKEWIQQKQIQIPDMPFIPPYVVEESNIPKAKELNEWIRKIHLIKQKIDELLEELK